MAGRDLDFWIGDWRCEWEGGVGENRVEPILGGAGVLERFTGAGIEGVSVSHLDATLAIWRQTWADTDGTWIHLTGGPTGRDFVLVTVPEPTAPSRRMVFSEIERDSLLWRWQFEEHRSWSTRWEIRYHRR